ncbi:hypothetical protein V6N13_106791 [Hibiscus sabdariffa]
MRLLSWNVRGLGSVAKRRSVQNVLRRQRCGLAILQETKMESISEKVVKQIWFSDSFRGMDEFCEFVNAVALCEIPSQGKAFTWFGPRNKCSRIDRFFVFAVALCEITSQGKAFTGFGPGNKCSRIDRFFVSADCFTRFKRLVMINLSRELSDHALIILVSYNSDSGPKPFRFFNAWLRNPQHVREMECFWNGFRQGEGTDSLVCKIHAMKGVLKVWNRDSFGNVDDNYRELVDELEQLDTKQGGGELDDNDLSYKRDLISKFWKVSRLRESIWR